jgi:hypothetical protein
MLRVSRSVPALGVLAGTRRARVRALRAVAQV